MAEIDKSSRTLVVEGKYRVSAKVGEGSFGKIYSGINSNTGEAIAIKIEKISEHSILKHEAKIYKLLEGCHGIPKLRSFGQEGVFNYMVIDLLDDSLEEMRTTNGGSLSLKTVLMLGIQMLYRIETIHSLGIIHRDIKPANFLMKNTNELYLIDFGLARRYLEEDGAHIKQETSRKLTGTARYASVNVHNGSTPSRRDDLEAIGYTLLYLLNGKLPWQNIKSDDKTTRYKMIGEEKTSKALWDHFKDSSIEFILYIDYCRKLQFDETPDYSYLRNMFENLFKLHGFVNDNNMFKVSD